MTRRKFVQKLANAGSLVLIGAAWLANKASPRRFIRAARLDRYPGPLRPPHDIFEESKWSG